RTEKRRKELTRRQKALLREHGEKWRKEDAPDCVVVPPHDVFDVFRRGFIAFVQVSAGELLKQPPELWPLAPTQTIRIVRSADTMVNLAQSSRLARLTRIELRAVFRGSTRATATCSLRALTQSPHARNLAYLGYGYNLVDDFGARAIARSPY